MTLREGNVTGKEPPLGCFVLFVISGEFLLSMPPFPTFTTSSIFTNLFTSVLKSFHPSSYLELFLTKTDQIFNEKYKRIQS